MIVEQYESREEWLPVRPTFVGASESPVLVGHGYANQGIADVWLAKVAPKAAEFEPSVSMRLGTNCQRGVIQTANEVFGLDLEPVDWAIVRSDKPHIACSPDAWAPGRIPAEVKNLTRFGARTLAQGEIPLIYQIQMQHQMYCCEAPQAILVANLANEDVVRFYLERDDELIQGLVAVIDEFWQTVLEQVKPEFTNPEQHAEWLKKRYPKSRAVYRELPDWAIEAWAARDRESTVIKTAEAAKKAAENRIKEAMEDAEYGRMPDGRVVRWQTQTVVEHTVKTFTKRVFSAVKTLPADADLDQLTQEQVDHE